MSAAAVRPQQPSSSRALEVVIVGAGFGGIAAAIELRRHGIDDVTILEKAPDLGGTWFYNSYPGAACDVPSHLYSFSFAQRRDWSRLCSPQAEIHAYLHDVARAHGIDRLVQHGHDRHRLLVGRGALPLERRDRERRRLRGGRADPRDRAAGPALAAEDRGRGELRRPQLPLGRMGPRLPARGQARGGRRHRRERRAVRARDRADGQAHERVPAHRQLVPAAPQPPLQRRRPGRDRARPRAAGAAPQVRVRVHRVADARDPPPRDGRAPGGRALGRVHALAAQGPGAAREGVAGLHVRLQAHPLQLPLPACARAPQRRARHRRDREHRARRHRHRLAARCTRSTA